MIDRELTDAEALVLQEADAASKGFNDALERLQRAFEQVVVFNLRERSRLEAELAAPRTINAVTEGA